MYVQPLYRISCVVWCFAFAVTVPTNKLLNVWIAVSRWNHLVWKTSPVSTYTRRHGLLKITCISDNHMYILLKITTSILGVGLDIFLMEVPGAGIDELLYPSSSYLEL